MNFLYYLLPKEKVAYINENSTLRQAMEKMEHHRYTAVPIINKKENIKSFTRRIFMVVKNMKEFDLEQRKN